MADEKNSPEEKADKDNAQSSADSGSQNTPKRFSDETLFAFALPEAMDKSLGEKEKAALKALDEKRAKSKAAAKKEQPTVQVKVAVAPKDKEEAREKSGGVPHAPLIAGGIALLVVLYFVFRPTSITVPTDVASSDEEVNVEDTQMVADASPPEKDLATVAQPAKDVVTDQPTVEMSEGEKPLDLTKKQLAKLAEPETKVSQDGSSIPPEEKLLESLENSDLAMLKSAIAEAEGKNQPELGEKLMKLGAHPNYLIRINVIKVLSAAENFPQAKLVKLLSERLNDDEYLVRGFAARGLGTIGGNDARAALQKRLAVEENGVVKKVLKAIVW